MHYLAYFLYLHLNALPIYFTMNVRGENYEKDKIMRIYAYFIHSFFTW